MKNNRRLVANIVEIAMGLVLTVCGYFDIVDEYWCGMGTALIFVGLIMLVRLCRYKTNAEYKEKVDVEVKDERNKYLRGLAWSWTGYLFVLIAAFASIILKILGFDQYSLFAGLSVCLLILLYWGSYWLLSRRH